MAAQIPMSSNVVGTRESQLTISPVSATFPPSPSPAPGLVPPTYTYSPSPTPLPLPEQAHFISPSNSPAPLLGYQQNGARGGATTKSPSAQAAIDTYNRLKAGFGRPPWSQGPPQAFTPPPPMPPQVLNTYPNGYGNQYSPSNQPMYYPQMANNTVAPNPPLLLLSTQKKWYKRKMYWLILVAVILGLILILVISLAGKKRDDVDFVNLPPASS
ncbi:hypothetical protein DFH27DRAFT_371429 [Peziza echinospora]|nr:hypothetical protein DFH27DRAFT_371429 [Peziza echinospora]